MKRPLSLLEVTIGLCLAAILVTTLFSSFRHLMQSKSQMESLRQEKHWEYITHVRLNQVFENIHDKTVFNTEPYQDISVTALHFTFNNGVDADPQFCQELEGFLFVNKEDEFCLMIQSKGGKDRKEVLLKKAKNYSIQFFDPSKKKWQSEWNKEFLPPLVKISISGKTFHFVLPHANRTISYST